MGDKESTQRGSGELTMPSKNQKNEHGTRVFRRKNKRDSKEMGDNMEKVLEENKKLTEENKILQQECERLRQELGEGNHWRHELKQQLDDVTMRYSQLVEERLQLSNKRLTVLGSNPNSAETLVERFHTQLYTQAWCDAYEVMSDHKLLEREIVPILLDICMNCWFLCCLKMKADLRSLLRILQIKTNVMTDDHINVYVSRDVTLLLSHLPEQCRLEFRSNKLNIAPETLETLFQDLIHYSKFYKLILGEFDSIIIERMKSYIILCLELSWKMVLQEPAMHLHFYEPIGSAVNRDLYDIYSGVNDNVEYVVWPVIFRELDGVMMRKGLIKTASTC